MVTCLADRLPAAGPLRLLCAAALALLASACSTLPRNPLPEALVDEVSLPGMPVVRAVGARTTDPAMMADLILSFEQEPPELFPRGPDGRIEYAHLALSGGGPDGAFGAGILNGWTRSGQRPLFKVVTGISTGALMAPFAFLGPQYDEALREFYTTTDSQRIFTRLPLLRQLASGESLADSAPLQAMIATVVDQRLLDEVARAHGQGRRLYMGTADIDSQRFMVWNMGLIATSGHPEALALFRKVMLASSSIPIAFPPVLFEVEASDGRRYDEMHVDGAVGANVFLSGGVFDFGLASASAGREPAQEQIFIIHNGQLAPVHGITNRRLGSIALRSLQAAAKASVLGDLIRIYAESVRKGSGYNWVTIPGGVSLAGGTAFDPVLMGKLFELGYALSKEGDFWTTSPPGLRDN
jgi:predicted acylesterase/phospholipase RssA